MPQRQPHIDSLKVIGSQLIVLHHFSAYGPLAEALEQVAPSLLRWFYDYARMAVQIFLVIGGFLAVQSLSRIAQGSAGTLARAIGQRHLRLMLPLLVALVLAVVCAAVARPWLSADFVPAAPAPEQILAHALLLHGVLGVDALSAGVWYVAIDFQLYALLALLLWIGQRGPHGLAVALVLSLMVAALLLFNRHAELDNWAIYFFGSYGLGVSAFWAGRSRRPWLALALLTALVLVALLVDYRTRIALSLTVALLLGIGQWRGISGIPLPAGLMHPLQALGRTSYALFLLHFPLLLLSNALYARLGLSDAGTASGLLLLTWVASMGLAFAFERWIEAPLARSR